MGITTSNLSLVIAVLSMLGTLASAFYSRQVNKQTQQKSLRQEMEFNERIKQQEQMLQTALKSLNGASISDLSKFWEGVNRIDPHNPITSDVIRAVDALDHTATYWLQQLIDKEIIFHQYWDSFRELYDVLNNSQTEAPGMHRRLCDFVKVHVRTAYAEINDYANRRVRNVKINE